MIAQPKYVSLTSGHAEGRDGLTAFDRALLEAGIGDVNLVKVSSIVPQGAQLVPLCEFPVGSLVPVVYAQAESSTPGEKIAAAVAVGLSPEGWGVIMECAGPGSSEGMEEEARARVEAAFAARGLRLHELHKISAEHTVIERGCAVAAAVLWGDEAEGESNWTSEAWTPHASLSFRVRQPIFHKRSPFQQIDVIDTFQFGRVLLLDGIVQTSEWDQWAYHEMLVHVPLLTHPRPRRVLIVGGGDGGALCAALDHPVERVVMVEIDRDVVTAAREHMPIISKGAFEDPRASLVFEDAFAYLEDPKERFDAVVLDSPDPVGPAIRLFQPEFYARVAAALEEGGVVAAQSGSPWFQPEVVKSTASAMQAHFPLVRLYLGNVPTYPGGLWSFALGSKGPDPLKIDPAELESRFQALKVKTRYYTPQIHKASFTLPPFIQELLGGD